MERQSKSRCHLDPRGHDEQETQGSRIEEETHHELEGSPQSHEDAKNIQP